MSLPGRMFSISGGPAQGQADRQPLSRVAESWGSHSKLVKLTRFVFTGCFFGTGGLTSLSVCLFVLGGGGGQGATGEGWWCGVGGSGTAEYRPTSQRHRHNLVGCRKIVDITPGWAVVLPEDFVGRAPSPQPRGVRGTGRMFIFLSRSMASGGALLQGGGGHH